jgi:hypothetical protein
MDGVVAISISRDMPQAPRPPVVLNVEKTGLNVFRLKYEIPHRQRIIDMSN